ncbi:putative enoyl-CoA hydratase echA8 [Paraburkholderia nemoris]|uniref:enoyl-CoA hydratase/isomerase family protein n=1 Tax=Paraburkholderia nemoris TaxID=2793076 RepID=UPI00190B88F5|nr:MULTISPECIES: enoyl-CoA hydratase/isomerase family protein [Paraburkholderia]MBK3786314.1 enoyl-CoA hydratase/isomerase family protein [Paraburkholderia aspalathi]CAE6851582.1 putative enoyl-CoA hydratase echA8 [Paraburkholderia nemoris]
MTEEVILFEAAGPVAYVTLNRPKAMNAINLAMLAALDGFLDEISRREDLRVVVVSGNGPAFCAGADLKEVLAGATLEAGEADFLDHASAVFNRLRDFPKPVIASVNGTTMAGGLELAMCADIVVAAESATIGDAHANFGVYPGAGAAAVLPRLIPLNMALYLLFSGKSLSAAQMLASGLVSEVHPDERLASAVKKLAENIALKSPIALSRMKAVARASADKTQADALLHEQVMLRQHLRSADLQEGLRAFAEKRTPRFVGR